VQLSLNLQIRQKAIDRIDHDLAGVLSLHSKETVPSVLRSGHVKRVMGVRLSCSDSREIRMSMVDVVSKNRRKVPDIGLTIPFTTGYLGTGAALSSLYPSKFANGMLVRIVNKIDGLK
jgi:hypothetical protein